MSAWRLSFLTAIWRHWPGVKSDSAFSVMRVSAFRPFGPLVAV